MPAPKMFFASRRRHTSWPRDWSSDVCSSDLKSGDRTEWAAQARRVRDRCQQLGLPLIINDHWQIAQIGRASCRERVENIEGDAGLKAARYIKTRHRWKEGAAHAKDGPIKQQS